MEVNDAPIERSKKVVEESENDLENGAHDEVVQAGNTVTECRKELEIAPGDAETKANDPPNERDEEVAEVQKKLAKKEACRLWRRAAGSCEQL